MTFAINVDPDNPDTFAHILPATLFAEKFRGVRFTSRNTDINREYVQACRDNGLRVLAIITGESADYLVPGADVYQIGNEPEQNGIDADAFYWNWWKFYRETYPQPRMYMAGLASGGQRDLDFAARVLQLCTDNGTPPPDAIALHPYLKDSAQAADAFDAMWNLTNIPVIATEWYQQAASGDMWNFVGMLNDPATGRSTEWNSFFCYTDAMVPPFGIRAVDGTPKDDYYSLLSAPYIP
jgi:hypothetical protein